MQTHTGTVQTKWKRRESSQSFFFFLMFIFERETERDRASRGGAEREGKRESETGVVNTEPDKGLTPRSHEIMT